MRLGATPARLAALLRQDSAARDGGAHPLGHARALLGAALGGLARPTTLPRGAWPWAIGCRGEAFHCTSCEQKKGAEGRNPLPKAPGTGASISPAPRAARHAASA